MSCDVPILVPVIVYRRALGAVLKKLRRLAKMTQEEAAELSKTNRSHLSRIEAGVHDTNTFTVYLLARMYGVDLVELAAHMEDQLLYEARKDKK